MRSGKPCKLASLFRELLEEIDIHLSYDTHFFAHIGSKHQLADISFMPDINCWMWTTGGGCLNANVLVFGDQLVLGFSFNMRCQGKGD